MPSRNEPAKKDKGSEKKMQNVTPCDKPCITLLRNRKNAAGEWVNKIKLKIVPDIGK